MTPPRSSGDRGAVTAEVAIAIPAVVVVLIASLNGLGAAVALVRAQDAAAVAARSLARGDASAGAVGRLVAGLPGGALRSRFEVDLVCATVTVRPSILSVPIALDARSCALHGGR